MIRDVNFGSIEPFRGKCVYYAKDGNTIKVWNKTLYHLSDISNYQQENMAVEVVNYKYSTSYALYALIGKVYVRVSWINECYAVENISDDPNFQQYLAIGSVDDWNEYLLGKVSRSQYINNLEIEVLRQNGKFELAAYFQPYHDAYIAQIESEDKRGQEKFEKERAENEAQEEKERESMIAAAEDKILHGGKLDNKPLPGRADSIILFLCDKYGISVPIKTRGWIKKNINFVLFSEEGKPTNYSTSGKGKSQTFCNKMFELADAVAVAHQ